MVRTPTARSVGQRLFERDSERWMTWRVEEPMRPFETGITIPLVKNGKACWPRWRVHRPAASKADITHIDMGDERASETRAACCTVAVRDRLHLAEVMRTLVAARPPCCAWARQTRP